MFDKLIQVNFFRKTDIYNSMNSDFSPAEVTVPNVSTIKDKRDRQVVRLANADPGYKQWNKCCTNHDRNPYK